MVPCHRVLAADGLGGFGGGRPAKEWLLGPRRRAHRPPLPLTPAARMTGVGVDAAGLGRVGTSQAWRTCSTRAPSPAACRTTDLRLLRDTEPVSWQHEPAVGIWPAGPGFWAVTRYDDVRHVLRSPAEFSSALGATQIRDPDPADLPFIRRMILNMDPPEQLRLRRLVTGAFTRRRLERFAGAVRARAAALLDGVAGRPFDLPGEVTDDFPLQNLADLLGVPAADRALLLTLDQPGDRLPGPGARRGGHRRRRPPGQPALAGAAGRHVRLRRASWPSASAPSRPTT